MVLDDLDLDIAPGEFVALIGRSGSGKSTLLRALAGLDREITGDLDVDGEVSIAFQEPGWCRGNASGPTSAWACAPRNPGKSWPRPWPKSGSPSRASAWPLTLSGGEAQRASLARALVRDPSLLLLDEPFSALDALTRITMHQLVLDLWERHRPAILLVTHDVDEALALADRVLVLDDGRISHQARSTPRVRGTAPPPNSPA